MVAKYLHISHMLTFIHQMENDYKLHKFLPIFQTLTIIQLLEDSSCNNLNISKFKLYGHILDP
jgi:hypothetical protein